MRGERLLSFTLTQLWRWKKNEIIVKPTVTNLGWCFVLFCFVLLIIQHLYRNLLHLGRRYTHLTELGRRYTHLTELGRRYTNLTELGRRYTNLTENNQVLY